MHSLSKLRAKKGSPITTILFTNLLVLCGSFDLSAAGKQPQQWPMRVRPKSGALDIGMSDAMSAKMLNMSDKKVRIRSHVGMMGLKGTEQHHDTCPPWRGRM